MAGRRRRSPEARGTRAERRRSRWRYERSFAIDAGIAAFADGTDPLYFADRFLAGLRPYPQHLGPHAEIAHRVRELEARGRTRLVLQRTDKIDELHQGRQGSLHFMKSMLVSFL